MTASTLVYLAIVGGVWAFLWWYFARYVIGRRRIASGHRALGLVAWEYMQNRDNQRAVREILFTQEAWQERRDDGDRPNAGRTEHGAAST